MGRVRCLPRSPCFTRFRERFFGPLVYLAGSRQTHPISVGLTEFNGLYNTELQLIFAASINSMISPLAAFFPARRMFIQGIGHRSSINSCLTS